jgi:hypothetical protein
MLIEQARGGDLAAIKLLFAYAIGKPSEGVDPDRVDVEEWKLALEASVLPELLSGVLRTLPADWVVNLLRIAWPCVAATMSEQMMQGLAEQEREEKAASRKEAEATTERIENWGNGAAKVGEARDNSQQGKGEDQRIDSNGAGQRREGRPVSRAEENSSWTLAWPAVGLEEMLVAAEELDQVVARADRPLENGPNGSGNPVPAGQQLDLPEETRTDGGHSRRPVSTAAGRTWVGRDQRGDEMLSRNASECHGQLPEWQGRTASERREATGSTSSPCAGSPGVAHAG